MFFKHRQAKLHLRQSNPQLTPATLQLQYHFSLIVQYGQYNIFLYQIQNLKNIFSTCNVTHQLAMLFYDLFEVLLEKGLLHILVQMTALLLLNHFVCQ